MQTGTFAPPSANAAIVTTARNAGEMINSFVAYHLAIGFARLFIFFDDPADPDLPCLAAHPQITAIAHDGALRREWETLPEYAEHRAFLDSEVMARQVLNAGIAMKRARDMGLDWLLHIDADELFFSPNQSVAEHLAGAGAERADTAQYPNFEAVPETADIADAFREVDLFKIPPALNPGPFTDEGVELLRATPQLPQGLFFHFYSNGKSAVRLGAAAARPNGVHRFCHGTRETVTARNCDAYILHYACSGVESYWQKYRTLGHFADRWLEKDDIRQAIGPLHLDARDVVATGDRDAALAFYRQRIAIEDRGRADALIGHGVLLRIAQPRMLLERLRAP